MNKFSKFGVLLLSVVVIAFLSLGAAYLGPDRVVRIFNFGTAPVVTDDAGSSYEQGDLAFDHVNNELYFLMDHSIGAANWDLLTGTDSDDDVSVASVTTSGAVTAGTDATVGDLMKTARFQSGITPLATDSYDGITGVTLTVDDMGRIIMIEDTLASQIWLPNVIGTAYAGMEVSFLPINTGVSIYIANSSQDIWGIDSVTGTSKAVVMAIGASGNSNVLVPTLKLVLGPSGITWYPVSGVSSDAAATNVYAAGNWAVLNYQ